MKIGKIKNTKRKKVLENEKINKNKTYMDNKAIIYLLISYSLNTEHIWINNKDICVCMWVYTCPQENLLIKYFST